MLKPLAWGNPLVLNSKNTAGAFWLPSKDTVPKYKLNFMTWVPSPPGQMNEQATPPGQENSH